MFDFAIPIFDFTIPIFDFTIPIFDFAIPIFDFTIPIFDFAVPTLATFFRDINISCYVLGFTRIIPYLYPVYLTILLMYRSYRFEVYCHQKYGLTWEEYCKRVRYRIFPNIF